MYDFIVVGAGLSGAVFAQQCRERGLSCWVVDRNDHVAGNCHTERRHDIDVHVHGPHLFNTNSLRVWDYVNRFAAFNQYTHRVKVAHGGRLYSFPINLFTLYQVYGVTTPAEARKKLDEVRVPIEAPANLEEWCLSQVGPELYEIFVKGYTSKQWSRDPRDLPSSIIRRIPIRLNFDDRYHESRYCGIPDGGYTAMVANILDGVKVSLGIDFFNLDWRRYAKRLYFTGPADELFGYCHGELGYRSLRFEERVQEGDFQGAAQVNYTEARVPYTRVVEHKHINFKNQSRTVVTWEFPQDWERGRPAYYPLRDGASGAIHDKYQQMADDAGIILAGRLGKFRYLDMDAAVAAAIKSAEEIGKSA